MQEIVNRLHENRQVELAKSILESRGYKVTKKSKRLTESSSSGLAWEWVEDQYMDPAHWESETSEYYFSVYPPSSVSEYEGYGAEVYDREEYEPVANEDFSTEEEAKEWIEKNYVGDLVRESNMKWTFNGDDMYFLTDYEDEGSGDLPVISDEGGVYVATLSGGDYRGESFEDIDKAIEYVEANINKDSLERYYNPGVHEYDGEPYHPSISESKKLKESDDSKPDTYYAISIDVVTNVPDRKHIHEGGAEQRLEVGNTILKSIELPPETDIHVDLLGYDDITFILKSNNHREVSSIARKIKAKAEPYSDRMCREYNLPRGTTVSIVGPYLDRDCMDEADNQEYWEF